MTHDEFLFQPPPPPKEDNSVSDKEPRCYECIHFDVCHLRMMVDDFHSDRLNVYNWVANDADALAMIQAKYSPTDHCKHCLPKETEKHE